jgi:hypothetical protein
MKEISNYQKENWEKLEQRFPDIKNLFELQVVKLRLFGHGDAFVKINTGFDKSHRLMLRCHVLKERQWKIFSFYYNTVTDKMFIRNQLDRYKHLVHNADRVYIDSIDQLDSLLGETIIKL